jgi:hypothetical protein
LPCERGMDLDMRGTPGNSVIRTGMGKYEVVGGTAAA